MKVAVRVDVDDGKAVRGRIQGSGGIGSLEGAVAGKSAPSPIYRQGWQAT